MKPRCPAPGPVALASLVTTCSLVTTTHALAEPPSQSALLLTTVPFQPPSWARHLANPPTERVVLGRLPTPIHRFECGLLSDLDVEWWIKRDDLSGFDLGGNKVRKLEFLLAQAKAAGHDCVITIGGVQSNHCRATAVAARLLGLDSYLILRTANTDEDPGMVGNLLFDRLVGAQLRTVSTAEYAEHGSVALGTRLEAELRAQGRNPYVIPVGGSNAVGTWGYLAAVDELAGQLQQPFDHCVFACGSGGTAAGIGLGFKLAGLSLRTKVTAVGVCDTPQYFLDFIKDECTGGLGISEARDGTPDQWLTVLQGRNRGYAVSTPDELEFIAQVAKDSGVLLDPVYSGKALYAFVRAARADPERYRGSKILFWHTGGALGMYEQASNLKSLVDPVEPLLK